ncbi:hypothetical protein MLD38_033839 [Melastoma candidum]|uniref:Uncharacterized protein n=1 Tax=Melastoma candidum TaxID=119954 RepID=A0ACB9MAC3_9MYRT|nr:hypothetical protein MLD38_033839 [Melastoma candidum]
MLKEEPGSGRGAGGGTNAWARTCDTCGTAACAVYCLADSAYLCSACDARVHAVNRLASRHERLRVCESCERVPAAFLCKADAASLCAACDAEVHSANPLARRHHRVPIIFPGGDQGCCDEPPLFLTEETVTVDEEEEDEEAASWLLVDQGNAGNFLDLVEYSDSGKAEDHYTELKGNRGRSDDSVVPIKFGDGGEGYDQLQQHLFLGLHFEPASKVSLPSVDMRVVPESSSLVEVSVTHPRPPKGTINLFSGPPVEVAVAVQLTGSEREARVMRYREKKKMRKFVKTIRYASRKAYAETRPRIKGRFAKRTDIDIEIEVDQMFSATEETGYGVVPSF